MIHCYTCFSLLYSGWFLYFRKRERNSNNDVDSKIVTHHLDTHAPCRNVPFLFSETSSNHNVFLLICLITSYSFYNFMYELYIGTNCPAILVTVIFVDIVSRPRGHEEFCVIGWRHRTLFHQSKYLITDVSVAMQLPLSVYKTGVNLDTIQHKEKEGGDFF